MEKRAICLPFSLFVFLIFLACLASWRLNVISAQAGRTPPQASADDQAEKIISRAIEALGGAAYLNVRSAVGRGLFTPYKDGVSQVPAKFVDYLAYPDKERTEFGGGSTRVVQANDGATGWIYDGATKLIKDQNTTQLEDFKVSMRTSVENVLHGWWRPESAKLGYVGRREAGVGSRNETIRLTYPDGFWIEYEFGAKDGLPARVIYRRRQKKSDTEEMEEIAEEDRLLKPVTIERITAPFVVDHYIKGVQTSRINYESIEYNRTLSDSLFTKPATIKGLK
jgi:hypothetical protein